MTISPLRLALVLLLIGLLGWVVIDYLGDQVVTARQALSDTQSELDSAYNELADQREAARLAGEMLDARNEIDNQRTQELNRALDENLRLQRDVTDGRQRLLVKATCAAPVPGAAGSAGVADAGTAELDPDARSDYFTLRDQLALAREMILGLQDYIRRVVQRTPAQP
ncbi:lysis protein [Pseudomonas sp. 3A(2025)]